MNCDPATLEPLTVLGAVAEPFDGVGYARFAQPFERLSAHGIRLQTLGARIELERHGRVWRPSASALDGVSLVIFPQSVASPVLDDGSRVDLVGGLCEQAGTRGISVVYSVDDDLASIERDNPNHERISASLENLAAIRCHADALIATTPTLAAAFEPWNVPTHVLPNTIDPRRWRERPHHGGRPTIGWAGSGTHLDDLLLVLPTLVELQRRTPFRFVVFGLTDLPLDEQRRQIESAEGRLDEAQLRRARSFLRVHDLLRSLSVTHVPFGTVGDYIRRLPTLDLDIGLCPLRDSTFNRSKSALKFYEYAACGTLCVASDVEPYRGEVSQLAADPAAWAELLEFFLCDPEARDREQARQRAWVIHERSIDRWLDPWAETLRSMHERRASQQMRFAHVAP